MNLLSSRGAWAPRQRHFRTIMSIPTVKIHHPTNRRAVIINEADFDPEKHELFKEPSEVQVERYGAGYWKIIRDGEVIEKGRGDEDLEAALRG